MGEGQTFRGKLIGVLEVQVNISIEILGISLKSIVRTPKNSVERGAGNKSKNKRRLRLKDSFILQMEHNELVFFQTGIEYKKCYWHALGWFVGG